MKDILKQYNDLQDEIKDLEKRIKQIENFKVEHDKVTGSNSEFPYQAMSFTIEGYNINDVDKLNETKALLIMRKCQCEDLKLEIEKFISTIPDSRTRRVFQYRYIDGLEWLPISMRFGRTNESYSRMIHKRYLESLEEGFNVRENN